jgi:hypothetical protein
MLIVAIPKSASTSLMHSLGKASAHAATQLIFPEEPPPNTCTILHQYHSDVRKLTDQHIQRFTDPEKWYKQHIYPSRENLEATRHLRKVVLLRDPKEIIAAYHRAVQAHVHKEREELTTKSDMENWLDEAKRIGLQDDLAFFYNNWIQEAEDHPEQTLIVQYADLLARPDETMRTILAFFSLEAPKKPLSLSKKRYSRGSRIRNFLNSLLRKLD